MDNRPSGFSRTIGCPGSRRMIARAPVRTKSTTYADEGTAAHTLVYKCLTSGEIPVEHLGSEIKAEAVWKVTPNMVQATSVMVSWCRTLMNHPNLRWMSIEDRLEIPGLDMPKGGTGDFVCIIGKTLHVVDYKHGAGVFVHVEGNAQFLSYGHGALNTAPKELASQVEKVVLHCVQPRCGAIPRRQWPISVEALGEWLNNVAIPAVEKSRAPDAPLVPGDWCGFCEAKGFCTAPLKKMADIMNTFTAPETDIPQPEVKRDYEF